MLLENPRKISTLEKRWGQVKSSFCVEKGIRDTTITGEPSNVSNLRSPGLMKRKV